MYAKSVKERKLRGSICNRVAIIIMALRYMIETVIEEIFDDEFRLSDDESSDEDGKDIYGYGKPVLRRADIRDLSELIVPIISLIVRKAPTIYCK